MDGFIHLLKQISIDYGVSEKSIFIKGNKLPGFFRPTKDWDFLIVSPQKHLISCIEFKSKGQNERI
jgi:Restriction endonuclease XhoI